MCKTTDKFNTMGVQVRFIEVLWQAAIKVWAWAEFSTGGFTGESCASKLTQVLSEFNSLWLSVWGLQLLLDGSWKLPLAPSHRLGLPATWPPYMVTYHTSSKPARETVSRGSHLVRWRLMRHIQEWLPIPFKAFYFLQVYHRSWHYSRCGEIHKA